MLDSVLIRPASPADAPAMLAIYAPYVQNTAVSFELEPPSQEEFAGRVTHTLARFPWLAAVRNGEIVGYCYASPFHPRAAYAWAAESSLYLAPQVHGQGLGARLYAELARCLEAQHVQSLNACIACPRERDDPFLTPASLRFHRALGFSAWGHAKRCAFKFGRWYDMVWMEKPVGRPATPPLPFRPFPQVRESLFPGRA